MKTVFVSGLRGEIQDKLNEELSKLKTKDIIDVKFTSGEGNNSTLILCALILYKD